jgi:hypothetical protein
VRFVLSLVLLAQLLAPATVSRAQDSGACGDLSQQIASTGKDLDQLQQDALPWLVQAGQFGPVAVGDLLLAAEQGQPGLTPGLAASYGATAAQVGAAIDGWRSANDGSPSDQYWRDLANMLSTWETLFSTLAPVQDVVPSLVGMSTAFSQLDQLSAQAQGDLALQDALSSQLQDCQAANMPPMPEPPTAGDNGGATCDVDGKTGASNSECYTLELDAAFAVWEACTEDYFAAERAAFQNGSDLPINTCDGPWAQAQDELYRKWIGTPPA